MTSNYLETPERIKRCPACKSIFINDQECEACGWQLKFNPLGEPFGERSLYQMNKKMERRRYCAHLVQRYKVLVGHLFSKDRKENDPFFIELFDVIEELRRLRVSSAILMEPINKSMNDPLYNLVSEKILRSHPKKGSFLEFRVMGIRPVVFLTTIFFFAVLIWLAVVNYSYLLRR